MEFETNKISLEIVSLKVNSKKFSNSMLDQIPRKDLAKIIYENNLNYPLEIICRFSLVMLLNSQRRIYKTEGCHPEQINRLIELFNYQDEGILFNFNGELYCDSYSTSYGTKQYNELLQELEDLVSSKRSNIGTIENILERDKQGDKPAEILAPNDYKAVFLPSGRARSTRAQQPDLNVCIDEFGATECKLVASKIQDIKRTYGSWSKYIKHLKDDLEKARREVILLEQNLVSFENKVTQVLDDIHATPFVLLGS